MTQCEFVLFVLFVHKYLIGWILGAIIKKFLGSKGQGIVPNALHVGLPDRRLNEVVMDCGKTECWGCEDPFLNHKGPQAANQNEKENFVSCPQFLSWK